MIMGTLAQHVVQVRDAYHRLVILVGAPRSGKTETLAGAGAEESWPRINLNLVLAERLLDLTVKQRALRVPSVVDQILRESSSETVVVDNIEMLFNTELALDPLRLLQNVSRNRTIVAAWPGVFDSDVLTYGEPSHPEFRKYFKPQALIVPMSESLAGAAVRQEASE